MWAIAWRTSGLGECKWLFIDFPLLVSSFDGVRSLKAEQQVMSAEWSSRLRSARERRNILMERKTLFLSGPVALIRTLESEAGRAVQNQPDTATGRGKEEYQTFKVVARMLLFLICLSIINLFAHEND